MDIVSIFGNAASIIAAVTTVSAFIVGTTKGGKKILSGWFSKLNEPTNKAILCVLRSNLRDTCYRCLKKEYLTDEDFEDIVEAADAYDGLGGNSYTHQLVKRALELPVRTGGVYCGTNNTKSSKK